MPVDGDELLPFVEFRRSNEKVAIKILSLASNKKKKYVVEAFWRVIRR